MRNEIYEKIKQNRMRYIAELKNARSIKQDKEEESDKPANTGNYSTGGNDYSFEIPKFWKNISFPDITIDTTGIFRVLTESTKIIKSGAGYLFNKINAFVLSINRKLNSKADKITDGFYNYSSRFFEDRFEDTNLSDQNMVKAITVTPAVAIEVDYNVFDNTVLSFKDIWKSLCKNRIIRGIVLFLELDDEISNNETPISRNIKPEGKTIEVKETGNRFFNNALNSVMEQTGKATKKLKRKVKISNFEYKLKAQGIFSHRSKPASAKKRQAFFPAINKFIRY